MLVNSCRLCIRCEAVSRSCAAVRQFSLKTCKRSLKLIDDMIRCLIVSKFVWRSKIPRFIICRSILVAPAVDVNQLKACFVWIARKIGTPPDPGARE